MLGQRCAVQFTSKSAGRYFRFIEPVYDVVGGQSGVANECAIGMKIFADLDDIVIHLNDAFALHQGTSVGGKVMQARSERDDAITLVDNFIGSWRAESAEDVHVERIGFGVPMGGSLEYLDPLTISKALENRKRI